MQERSSGAAICFETAEQSASDGGPGLRLVRIGVSVERVGSLSEGLSHHRVVRGQRDYDQRPLAGSRTPVHKAPRGLVSAPRRGAKALREEQLFNHGVGRARRVLE